MSRIDIEGALPPLSEQYLGARRAQSLANERQKQQFARYLPPRASPMQDIAQSMTPSEGANLMQTDYHIMSGPLSGVRVHVCLAADGLHIVLSHANGEWVERLQRLQTRWQRQLHQWGFPCLLEVTHAGDIVG
ncbi:hypothetical protein AB8989_19460 [Yersinia hibernica]|uniref:Flagellar hook-length control protein FliK n=1 Tax=Yersinia hibernica TaxID=2339259 RepID=A0ABX5QVS8_9GAMM|nr:hypothetical protein [Yersinia hibernica]QAX77405.1 hypothetical protein D5F51_01820 [Yersinia hibernica]